MVRYNNKILSNLWECMFKSRYTHKGKTKTTTKKTHLKMTDKVLLWKENVKLHGINFSSITINRLLIVFNGKTDILTS